MPKTAGVLQECLFEEVVAAEASVPARDQNGSFHVGFGSDHPSIWKMSKVHQRECHEAQGFTSFLVQVVGVADDSRKEIAN